MSIIPPDEMIYFSEKDMCKFKDSVASYVHIKSGLLFYFPSLIFILYHHVTSWQTRINKDQKISCLWHENKWPNRQLKNTKKY